MKRLFDLSLASLGVFWLCVPMLFLAALVRLSSKGPALYWSDRIGRYNRIFKMPKFRTMHVETPALATDLLVDPGCYLTSVGKVLRKWSLDELPQLLCILKGEMSFVGPRPALYNQYDLIERRTDEGIHTLVPGLTGWAQVNGRDQLSDKIKVECDKYYLNHGSLLLDFKILYLTVLKSLRQDGVKH